METTLVENPAFDRGSVAGGERLPRPWRALGWLAVFVILHLAAIFLYVAGYGAYLGAQLGAAGQVVDPAAIQGEVEAHLQTPGALAGIYLFQFCLMLPLLLAISQFREQSRWMTLGVGRFPARSLLAWLPVLAVFMVLQMLAVRLFAIDPGEFMRSLAGSRHLLLILVMVLVAPVLEELLFRGYLFRAWRHTRLGLTGTLLLTSLLFTAIHGAQYHFLQLAFVFVLSLILGIARERSGSVLLPMLLHALNNLVSAVLVVYLGIL